MTDAVSPSSGTQVPHTGGLYTEKFVLATLVYATRIAYC